VPAKVTVWWWSFSWLPEASYDISASSTRRLGGLDSNSVLSDLGGRCATDGWSEVAIRISI
jgi:hypothetical protein